MRQRLIGITLAGGCIILSVIVFFMYKGQDRNAPEITIEEKSIAYTEGENYDILMQGVSASDDIDGDLTGKVFIDKIVPNGEEDAVVYYGVMDKAKNVGTATRKISYHAAEQVEEPDAVEEEVLETQEPEAEAEAVVTQEEVLQPNGVRPAIGLHADSMEVAVGTQFDVLSVVKAVIDDTDNPDDLSTRIQVEGTYNTGVPGTYSLTYYVKDSNGNLSDGKTFTLIVK